MKTLIVVGVLFCLELAVVANATTVNAGARSAQITVEFSDLDLTRQPGDHTVIPLIRSVAPTPCNSVSDIHGGSATQPHPGCVIVKLGTLPANGL
jgi:hypothetical protein